LDGYFVAKPFQQWLASEIPVVAEADPSNVVEEIGRGSETKARGPGLSNVDIASMSGVLDQIQNKSKSSSGKARRRG